MASLNRESTSLYNLKNGYFWAFLDGYLTIEVSDCGHRFGSWATDKHNIKVFLDFDRNWDIYLPNTSFW